jgi:arabinose-5-phosphate isomerase
MRVPRLHFWQAWVKSCSPCFRLLESHDKDVAMNSEPISVASSFDVLAEARRIIHAEAEALAQVGMALDERFLRVVEALARCRGRIVVTGIGKSADVAQKIVGTLNSTGTRAYLLDATRAVHGDLGMVHPDDAALVLSHSGHSEELLRLLGPLQRSCASMVAISGNPDGALARLADAAIIYGPIMECDPLALAPSTSTTLMMALGDAIAFVLSRQRNFTSEDFARYHPAGSLGRKLATVESIMRRGHELRIARASTTIRNVFAQTHLEGRRTGAIILVNEDGRLAGLFTDSDLARIFERRDDAALDRPIGEVMTLHPITIAPTSRVTDAIELLGRKKISELPVVDGEGRPLGLLDVTDLLEVVPGEQTSLNDNAPRLWLPKSA